MVVAITSDLLVGSRMLIPNLRNKMFCNEHFLNTINLFSLVKRICNGSGEKHIFYFPAKLALFMVHYANSLCDLSIQYRHHLRIHNLAYSRLCSGILCTLLKFQCDSYNLQCFHRAYNEVNSIKGAYPGPHHQRELVRTRTYRLRYQVQWVYVDILSFGAGRPQVRIPCWSTHHTNENITYDVSHLPQNGRHSKKTER